MDWMASIARGEIRTPGLLVRARSSLRSRGSAACIVRSMIALISCFRNRLSPAMSAGVLHPAGNSSVHKMIDTVHNFLIASFAHFVSHFV